jgi:DNA invertase Pin-like site-specific DNA recombinase
MLRSGKARGFVVYRLDRLARDLIVQETLLGDLRRIGAEVFSTSAAEAGYLTDDPDDPSRALIRQVLGAVAQYERSMIALRLRAGRRRKHDKGGYAFGAPGYGWRAEAGELVPIDDEQAVITRMCELHEQGESLRSISATLSTEGCSPRRAGTWHPKVIAQILARAK